MVNPPVTADSTSRRRFSRLSRLGGRRAACAAIALAFLLPSLPPGAAALPAPEFFIGLRGERPADGPGAAGLNPVAKTWRLDDWLDLGVGEHSIHAEFRARYLTWHNVYGAEAGIDPGDQALHLRTRLALRYRRAETLRLAALITSQATQRIGFEDREATFGEVVFENLYAEALEPWGLPLGIRLGRQDLFYGDGFLVAEGGPLDESRTYYVNGAVIASRIPLWAFDIFAVRNPRKDDYLPRINNQHTVLVEADEFAWGVMARREPRGGAPGTRLPYSIEPCYIYKKESHAGRTARIHTAGVRLDFTLGPAALSGEAAYQGGKVPAWDYPKPIDEVLSGPQAISALGGKASLKVGVASPLPMDFTAGYVFLSGDELKTRNKFEGWNPVLARWPIWSEAVAQALSYESLMQPMNQTLSYWQNLSAPWLALAYRGKHVGLEGRYMWLGAAQPLPTFERFENPQLEGPTDRGRLYTVGLQWNLENIVDGHLLYERFTPGDSYPEVILWDEVVIFRSEPRIAEYFRLQLSRTF